MIHLEKLTYENFDVSMRAGVCRHDRQCIRGRCDPGDEQ